jgi:hypothetical protein
MAYIPLSTYISYSKKKTDLSGQRKKWMDFATPGANQGGSTNQVATKLA